MSIRVERVREKIKFLVANVLQNELKDPRRGFVTVIRCDLSEDFRVCKVHVSVLADTEGEISRVMHMLKDARAFVQVRVAAGLATRVTPHIEFVRDQGAERSVEVSSLLAELAREREEREARAAAAAAEGDGDGDDGGEGPAAEPSPEQDAPEQDAPEQGATTE
ncbi:MAG: 30S ribosome-binding factor RbfA [Planctomycetota bacterium]